MDLASQLMPMLSLGLGANGGPAPIQQLGGAQPGQMTAGQQGGLTPFYDPNQLAQLSVDTQDYQRRNQLAQQLMSTGYVPNSGKFGMLAGIASMLGGKLAQSQNDSKLSDIVARQIQAEQQAAEAQHAQKLSDQTFTTNEDIRKSVAGEKAKKDYQPNVVQDGFIIDPNNPNATAQVPGFQQAQISTKAQEALDAAKATAMYREAPGAAEGAKLGMINKLMAAPQSPQRDAMLASLVPPEAFASLTGGLTKQDQAGIDKRLPVLQDTLNKTDNALSIAQDMKQKLTAGTYPSSFTSRAYNSNPLLPQVMQTTGAQELGTDTNNLIAATQAAMQSSGSRGSVALIKILQGGKLTNAQTPEAKVNALDTVIKELQQARSNPAAEAEHYASGGNPRSWASVAAGMAAKGPVTANIPPAAVAMLKADPSTADHFDATFGPGSSAAVLGQ